MPIRVEADYEPHTPIRYSTTAANYTLIATIFGALLALIVHSQFGIAPRWIAVIIVIGSVPIFMLIYLFARGGTKNTTRMQRNGGSEKLISSQPSNESQATDIHQAVANEFQDSSILIDDVDRLPIGIGYLDSNLQWIRANHRLATHLQVPRASLPGKFLQKTLRLRAPKLVHEIAQMVEMCNTVTDFEVTINPREPQLIKTVLSAQVYTINDSQSDNFILLLVTHDITETRIARAQLATYSWLTSQLHEIAPLSDTLQATADSIEQLFSDTLCLIVSDHNMEGELRIVDRACPLHKNIFNSPLTRDQKSFFTDVMRTARQKILAPLTEDPQKPITHRLLGAGFKSCWIYPISLSNGVVWGTIAVLSPSHTMRPSPKEREHLDNFLKPLVTTIERSELINRLKSEKSRLEYAKRAANLGVFDWHLQSDEVIWTQSMESLYGLEPRAFGRHISCWESLIPKNDLAKIAKFFRDATEVTQTEFTLSHRFIHQTGKIRWCSLTGKIEYSDAHAPLRIIGIATDITEQKAIEDQANQDRNRLQQALDAGGLCFWEWNIQTGEVQLGGCLNSMLGYNHNDIAPSIRAYEKLTHPEDRERVNTNLSKHLLGETKYYECEYRIRRKDGSWLWILDRGRVVERDLDGNPLRAIGVHSDISEIQDTRETMRHDAQKKDLFLATLAHELRNPLAPIRTGLEILKLETNPDTITQIRDTMSRQLLHLVRIIDDLLDISRITNGKLKLQIQRCLLQDITQLAIETSQHLIDRKNHIFAVWQPKEPIYLQGDAGRLAQVVSNLLKNAAKYTPNGGSISLTSKTSEKHITVIVEDSGVGIDPQHITAIFEMFHQVPESYQHAEGGLGIGLSHAKSITELHGGALTVFSRGLNQGTTVTLQIPWNKYAENTHH